MSSMFKNIPDASARTRHEANALSVLPSGSQSNEQSSGPIGFSPLCLIIATLGGLVTGGAIAGYLDANKLATSGFELQNIAAVDLDSASQSLVAQSAANLVDDAKSCRQPLAYLTFGPTETAGGTIRFRSGTYHSPNVRLGVGPSRIALPFPAPYAAGAGQIEIENTSPGADIFLRPGVHVDATQGRSIVNVHWKTDKPC